MTESAVTRALRSSASGIEVCTAPLAAIHADLALKRRRRHLAVGSLAAGVLVVASLALLGREIGTDPPDHGQQVAAAGEIALPTSNFVPGSGSDGALIRGIISMDQNNCLFLSPLRGVGKTWVVWPQGWSAAETNGRVELRDSEGVAVAVEGDFISMGGGYADVSKYAPQSCLPEEGEVAYAQTLVSSQ